MGLLSYLPICKWTLKNCQGGGGSLWKPSTFCTKLFGKQSPYLLTNNREFSRAILCPPMEKPRLLCVKPANNQDYQLKQLSWKQQLLRSSASVVVNMGEQKKTFLNQGSSEHLSDTTTRFIDFLKGCHLKVGLKFHGRKWYSKNKVNITR